MAIQINKIESAIMEFPNAHVDIGKYINLPIALECVLDETHGTAKIIFTDMRQADFEGYGVHVDRPFNANTPIEIKFAGQTSFIRMIVARDTCEMTRKDAWETWSHNVEFVDEVKLLEQEPVDNLTFKNPIQRIYEQGAEQDWDILKAHNNNYDSLEDYYREYTNGYRPAKVKGVYAKNTVLKLSDNASTFNGSPTVGDSVLLNELSLTVVYPSGKELKYEKDIPNLTTGQTHKDDYFNIDLDQEGEYRLELYQEWTYTTTVPATYKTTFGVAFFVGDIKNNPTNPFTIKGVIDRVLNLTPTKTKTQANKYTFRNNAEEYATEESPEFTFTGKHLFEVMLDVASYKKMFPAIYKNEIYFRPYYNGCRLKKDDLPPAFKTVINSAIDQYCNALDSNVENMVCINNSMVGSVVEPYKGGYITARANSGSAISETTAMIPTQSDIYKVESLMMGETDGTIVGEIMPYLYESEEYDSLSDITNAYPYSKAYALKYTRFAQNFSELAHRINAADTVAVAKKKPALSNIVRMKIGGSVGLNLWNVLSDFIGKKESAPFANLLFQPTYTPVVSGRVRQYKPYQEDGEYNATIFYNQQAEVVDSEALGEHLKGLIQKLGNHTEIGVYRFAKIDDIPTVGTLIDDKSVYNVSMTIYENHVDATLCLVDYAELSQYIGVKNEIKTSDISITKWSNRFVNWEEFLLFTHDDINGDALSISEYALDGIISFTDKDKALTCAAFTHYTSGGDVIVEAYAPIKHLAIGNSIYFQWTMQDNFAVGYQSEKAPSDATSAWTGTKYDRAQKAVRYCDVYGRAETVDFKLLQTGPTLENTLIDPDLAKVMLGEKTVTISFEQELGLKFKVDVVVAFYNGNKTQTAEYIVDFDSDETEKVVDVSKIHNVIYITAATIKGIGINLTTTKEKGAFYRVVGHFYPEKPDAFLVSEEAYFSVDNLLVDKNSAEALKYAAQYHFRQDWREFVIGSGMSNFCSLIGGACEELVFFTSIFPLNRFDRHIDLNKPNIIYIQDELPTFNVDAERNRIEITLPEVVTRPSTISWGLAGLDRNGNYQLIFGENKKGYEPFSNKIYLVAKKKNNEPQSRLKEI